MQNSVTIQIDGKKLNLWFKSEHLAEVFDHDSNLAYPVTTFGQLRDVLTGERQATPGTRNTRGTSLQEALKASREADREARGSHAKQMREANKVS